VKRGLALLSAICLMAPNGAVMAASRDTAEPKPRASDRYAMPPPGYSPDMSSDEAGLWMQMDKEEEKIKTSPMRIRDEKLNAYIGGLVCRLAGEYCPSIRVYIVEVPVFNASMAPNGMMLINTGLLMRTENEAQLAFVLGHEITHYMHRHSLQHWRRLVNTTGFMALFGIAAAGAGAPGLGDLAGTIATMSFYANSRDQERDADTSGFMRVTDAGYDPRQAPMIWRYVSAESKANPNYTGGRTMWLATHPAPEERIANMEKQAREAENRRSDWLMNADPFQQATAPFLGRWVSDELAQGRSHESIELFRRLVADMPGRGIYRYGLGEAYRKRNKGTDVAAATEAYRGALECSDAPAEAWRGLGLVAMKAGDNAAAKDAFVQYRAKAPDAEDKAMVDFYLSQL
jgi:predicted Zn-dependent protease